MNSMNKRVKEVNKSAQAEKRFVKEEKRRIIGMEDWK
jgi:hypothetical protein